MDTRGEFIAGSGQIVVEREIPEAQAHMTVRAGTFETLVAPVTLDILGVEGDDISGAGPGQTQRGSRTNAGHRRHHSGADQLMSPATTGNVEGTSGTGAGVNAGARGMSSKQNSTPRTFMAANGKG